MDDTRKNEIQYISKADNHYCAFPKASAYDPKKLGNWTTISGFDKSEAESVGCPIVDLYSAGEDYPRKYFNLCDEYPMRMNEQQFAAFIAQVKELGYTVK